MNTYQVTRYTSGPLGTNSYLLRNGNDAIIIDAAPSPDELLAVIKKDNLTVQGILLTHGHFDHFSGIPELLAQLPSTTPIYFHPADEEIILDSRQNGGILCGEDTRFTGKYIPLEEGSLTVGSFQFTVFLMPGHTPGGVAFLAGNDCFTGDAVFAGSVGRSDWAYSDGALLIAAIKKNILSLPDEINLWPGHASQTTVGRERLYNPFLGN